MTPLVVEPFGGMRAFSLALLVGDPRLVSRRGSKAGYARAYLDILGLRSGSRAGVAWAADVDPVVVEMWTGIEANPIAVARAVADLGPDGRDAWARARTRDLPGVSGRAACALYDVANAYGGDGGFKPPPTTRRCAVNLSGATLAARVARLSGQPLRFFDGPAHELRARLPCPPGTVVLIDGPYQKGTGYSTSDAPFDYVLGEAEAWASRGATVAICEEEPVPLSGWTPYDVTGLRNGQSRVNFSKSASEWLTVWRAR